MYKSKAGQYYLYKKSLRASAKPESMAHDLGIVVLAICVAIAYYVVI